MLLQGHEIDAARLQYSAFLRQVDPMQVNAGFLQHLGDRALLARQEARPQTVGILGQAQVQARRLDLSFVQRRVRPDGAGSYQRLDFPVGKNTCILWHLLHPSPSQA